MWIRWGIHLLFSCLTRFHLRLTTRPPRSPSTLRSQALLFDEGLWDSGEEETTWIKTHTHRRSRRRGGEYRKWSENVPSLRIPPANPPCRWRLKSQLWLQRIWLGITSVSVCEWGEGIRERRGEERKRKRKTERKGEERRGEGRREKGEGEETSWKKRKKRGR